MNIFDKHHIHYYDLIIYKDFNDGHWDSNDNDSNDLDDYFHDHDHEENYENNCKVISVQWILCPGEGVPMWRLRSASQLYMTTTKWRPKM